MRLGNRKNITLVIKGFFLVCFSAVSFLFFYGNTQADGAIYYFCDTTADHDPATLGNYFSDPDCIDLALSLPDFSTDEVTVVSGAIFDGDAIFRGDATNEGTINGDAIFYEARTINNGSITGAKTRYYTQGGRVTNDLISNGPWTVIADGAEVDLERAQYDDTTIFNTVNNGSFLYRVKSYYFNNAVDTSPLTLENYWNDEDYTDPALEFPYLLSDELNVSLGATYDGSPIFNLSGTNEGTITGNAIFKDNASNNGTVNGTGRFVGNFSENKGTVLGTKIRHYLTDVNVGSRNFISNGPWTVIADGAVVDLSLSTYDGTTTFTKLNGGSFTPQSIPVGAAPFYGVVVGTKIYVMNSGDDTVSVFDIPTDTVVATIPVGDRPKYGVAYGTKVYVNNLDGGTVSIIDTLTDTVTGTLTVGALPSYSTVMGTKIYVSHSFGSFDSAGGGTTVTVIDTADDSVVGDVSIVGDGPTTSTVVGNKLYVNVAATGNVSVIDGPTDTLDTNIDLDVNIGGSYFSTLVGHKLYVNNEYDSTVSVVDVLTNAVVGLITTPGQTASSSLVDTTLYIINRFSNSTVLNTATDSIIKTLAGLAEQTTATVLGNKVYVNVKDPTDVSHTGRIVVFDDATKQVSDTILIGKNPGYSLVVGNKIYAFDSENDSISIVDSTTLLSQLPNLVSFSTSSLSGTYSIGQSIPITAHFGRQLRSGSTMTVHFNSGGSAVLNTISGKTLSGSYTILSGHSTPDLAVDSITSANVTDSTNRYTRTSYDLPSSQGSFTAENSFITRNLGDAKNIVIGSYQTIPTGSNPYQISVPINGFMYVANQGGSSVSVIDQSTNAITATIPVGSEPYGLSVASVSGTSYIYVANIGSDTVSVIDTSTNTVVATVPVGNKPYYVATIGTNVYVTNGGSNSVSVIDANSNTVSNTISVGSYPRGIKAHGTDLYVANYGDPNYSGGNYISVIDSLTNTVSDTILLPAGSSGPRGVTVLNDKAYVANFRSNNVSVIDTATNAITATIPVGMGPRGIVGVGTQLYVENFDDGTVSVIDTNSNTVTDTVDVGSSPSGIMVSGTTVYITSFQDDKVYILDTTTNTLQPAPDEDDDDEDEGGGGGHPSGPVSGGGASGSHATILPPAVILTVPPTDCLPFHQYSISTGKPCPVLVNPIVPTIPRFIFNKNLQLNDVNSDVKELQAYLNTHGFILTPSGAGSPNNETTKFGALTYKSLVKFQEAYRDQILKPAGLLKGTGYFGEKTRAYVNK